MWQNHVEGETTMSSNSNQEHSTALVELRSLCSDYVVLDDEYQRVGADRERLRSQISELVEEVGSQELPGFGRVEITTPSRITSYDPKALDALLLELDAAGNPLAERIRETKREGQRAGSLRISRDR
jgi:hypothetical protein